MNVVMLGAPGAGKGTQADRFARAKRIPKISTGDILRDVVQKGTPLGRAANAIMARGELVGDDIMIGIVRERLARDDVRGGFVLDGFPRTVAQATALDEIMQGRDPLIVIDIVVSPDELLRRLGSRQVCEKCGTNVDDKNPAKGGACGACGGRLVQRADDNAPTIQERLKVYERQTKPLVEYYQVRPTFKSINGAQTPDQVAADLNAAIATVGGGGRA
ncbi:MAG TPA: adenylate kinase [Vicinamibacterales bacterium]|nr:adenylate kinase [Vicinamibacterales bacterium]